jgi:hypothetical protein
VRYAAYGLTLESDIPLRDLPAARGPADIRILACTRPPHAAVAGRGISDRGPDVPWLRLERNGEAFVLSFDGGGTFSLSADGRAITVHLGADGLTDTVGHLLVDQVLPLTLDHSGRLVIHGSGLAVDGRGVAFIGPGGAGKSTLAGSFGRHGGKVVADDALVVKTSAAGVFVEPAYPAIRVWPDVLQTLGSSDAVPFVDGYSEKRRLGESQGFSFASSPVRVERIYVVQAAPTRNTMIDRLPDRDAAVALLTHTFVLDPSDMRRLEQQLEQTCQVVEQSDVRSVSFPRGLERLDEVRREICRDLMS